MNNKSYFLKQIDTIIEDYNFLKENTIHDDFSGGLCPKEKVTAFVTKSKAAIKRIAGAKSEYYEEFLRITKERCTDGSRVVPIFGIVTALKEDIENGYLKNLSEIIHSEIFADYLEMADHLLSSGYKDASAVITGSTLENHLRKMCLKNGIDLEQINFKGKVLPKKADLLNSELCKKYIYNSLVQKQVTTWLDLRNKAAHGKYDEYTTEEVNLMIQGVTNFIATNPA